MSRPPVARPNTLRISVSDLTNQTVEIKSLYPNQVALVVFSLIARGHGNLNSRMLVIQPGRWNSRDEELRTVRPRTGVGHGQSIWSIMSVFSREFIFKRPAPDRFTTCTVSHRVSCLEHLPE
jgi:hypothetical protein